MCSNNYYQPPTPPHGHNYYQPPTPSHGHNYYQPPPPQRQSYGYTPPPPPFGGQFKRSSPHLRPIEAYGVHQATMCTPSSSMPTIMSTPSSTPIKSTPTKPTQIYTPPPTPTPTPTPSTAARIATEEEKCKTICRVFNINGGVMKNHTTYGLTSLLEVYDVIKDLIVEYHDDIPGLEEELDTYDSRELRDIASRFRKYKLGTKDVTIKCIVEKITFLGSEFYS